MSRARLFSFLTGVVSGATATVRLARRTVTRTREQEEMYRSLVDFAPEGIGVTDEEGQLLFANAALARMMGIANPADAVGKMLADFHHPDDLPLIARRMQALRETGRVEPAQLRWCTFDGRTLHVETIAVAIRRRGKLLYHGFARDLTERKKIEAELAASEKQLRALFDSALDAILVANDTGEYVDANPAAAELLGYPRDAILRMQVRDLVPSEQQHLAAERWGELLKLGSMRGEATIVRADGARRIVEYVIVANVLPGLHSVFMHDITGRKEAERSVRRLSAQLLRLQDEERRRIARQLHDTTAQNLAALRLNLARLGRWAHEAPDSIRDTVEDSVAITEQAINEIRTLAYLLHPPMFEEVGLLPSLHWLAQGFEERSGIEVEFDAPAELERLAPEIETAVFRVVQEALTNIQRHSGSRVARITLRKQPRELFLEIADEGHGLPPALRQNPKMLAAAGVGVAGIQERVAELGGETTIDSSDAGTTMRVTLPLPADSSSGVISP